MDPEDTDLPSEEEVPYSNPVSVIVPVSPEYEPLSVASSAATSSVPPVTTVAVACGVSPPQLLPSTYL